MAKAKLPEPAPSRDYYFATSATLRDYFAAESLAWCLGEAVGHGGNRRLCEIAAEWAYEIADAMLEARQKP